MKNITAFHLKFFIFLGVKLSIYLNRCVFVMEYHEVSFLFTLQCDEAEINKMTSKNKHSDFMSVYYCIKSSVARY